MAMKGLQPAAQILELTRQYWGHAALRPLQAEAIDAGIHGRDSLVVLPTGGGKSLCYQVPPLLAPRVDVVVSPLISLMKDQVDGLRGNGYPAIALHSGLSLEERLENERLARQGKARLIFTAPERLLTDPGIRLAREIGVKAFHIDEAHCISHWGHDFRREYRRLAELRGLFPGASVHAFTATATRQVREDIARQLQLRDPLVLVGTFDRPNLIYRVQARESVAAQITAALRRHAGEAAIVYCISRKESEELAAAARRCGIRAAHYHAGLAPEARRATQDRFAAEEIDVVVATVAFGMGIDRSDVRCVIHAALPKSIEHYQQETGRAGRDGLPAECLLLYSPADALRWDGLIRLSAESAEEPDQVVAAARRLLDDMRRYAGGFECRHATLVRYFGQQLDKINCGACDVCLGELGELEDQTETARKILSCVARVKEGFGAAHVAEVLRGARSERVVKQQHDQLSTYGLLRDMDDKRIKRLILELIDQELLERSGGDFPQLKLNPRSWEVMRNERAFRVRPLAKSVDRARVESEAWVDVDLGLFERLRAWRREQAAQRHVPPFLIFSDASLRELARQKPRSAAELQRVPGVSRQKFADFGTDLLGLVAQFPPAPAGARLERTAPRPNGRRGASQPKPSSAKAHAFELFSEGRSLDEVATQTGRAASTIDAYLADFIELQRPESVSRWVGDADYARIAEAIKAQGGAGYREVYERLEERVSYREIRIVAAHLRAQGATVTEKANP